MDKNGVPKEAQDGALSDDTTGGRQTPTGRPTRGNVAPMKVFFCLFFLPSREEVETWNFFLECRTSGKVVIEMKKSRLTLGNFINNKSFQRAQGKIDMSYPHCYSLVLIEQNFGGEK